MSKSIPKLRFKEFKVDWERKRLGKVFSIFNGYAFPSTDALDHGCRWVKIADVGINEMKLDSPSFLPVDYRDQFSKFLLREGDYVVALTRPILGGKLKIAKVDKSFDNSLLNQRVGKLTSENNLTFVYGLLQKESIIARIENRIAGTDPPNLSPNEIDSIDLTIPTFPEQQQIASFLSSVDEKIQQLTRKKELLEQYKKGVMQRLFCLNDDSFDSSDSDDVNMDKQSDHSNQRNHKKSQFRQLRFKDENGKAYSKWEEKRLGDVCESIKSGKSKASDNGVFPLYGSTGIIGACDEYSHDGIFVLIARVGANAGTINLVDDKFGVSDNTLVLICTQELNVQYVYFYLSFYNLNKLIFGSGQPLITGGQLKELNLFLPIIEEQQKIANYLSAIDTKIESVANQITQTQTFKKGLLQQMFV